MSAHQGDSFVFPPFAPPTARPETPAPPPVPEPVIEVEPFEFEVPLPAHDLGDPEADAAWDASAAESAPAAEKADEQDLPWLEMPDGGPTIHASEAAPAAPEPAVEAATGWGWQGDASALGTTAAEITPPPLATAGELTSVSAVPSPAETDEADEDPAPAPEHRTIEPMGFSAADAFAPRTEAIHPSAMAAAEPETPHSWPVEAMEPAALASDDAPVVDAPMAAETAPAAASSVDHAAFAEVADRLEEMARALRSDPGGFLTAHHDDPLGLLLAGYALGYRQGGRTA